MISDLKQRLSRCRSEAAVQTQVLEKFVATIAPPISYASESGHVGWIFTAPGPKHFCILKAARAISGMNAAIALAEQGFAQEVVVIIRTIVECTTLIDFCTTEVDSPEIGAAQQDYIRRYFEDYRREEISEIIRPRIRQGQIHDSIGESMSEMAERLRISEIYDGANPSNLMSNVYVRLSCYVHSRYPEAIDLYGGEPARFHLNGMSGTPKDAENVELIECYMESVSNSLRYMVHKFLMLTEISIDPELAAWLSTQNENI